MLAALLFALQTTSDAPAITVTAPPKATPQQPATMVVEPAAMLIASCDADGDAAVDRAELKACITRSWESMHPPADGMRYIAFADWAQRWLGDRNALPSPFEVDRDMNDHVTLDELQDQFARLFARYDADGDRQITRAELVTYRARPLGDDPRRPGGPQDGHDGKRKAPDAKRSGARGRPTRGEAPEGE